MEKSGIDFDQIAEKVRFQKLTDPLHGRVKRKFRTAPHDHFRVFGYALHDRIVGFFIDAKGFFAQQMSAGSDYVAVDLFVEIVRYCTVNSFNILVGKEFVVVVCNLLDGGEVILIPGIECRIFVADRHQFRLGVDFCKVAPAGTGTGKFPAHKTGTDNTEFNSFHFFILKNHSFYPRVIHCNIGISLYFIPGMTFFKRSISSRR